MISCFSSSKHHIFRMNTHIATAPISTVKIKLTFAAADCVNESATVSLYRLDPSSQHQHRCPPSDGLPEILTWAEPVCGPVKIKQFVDVTRLSLQLCLSHPALLISGPSAPLLLCFESLFADDYDLVTEEAVKAASEGAKPEVKPSVPRLRHIRSRILRRSPTNKPGIVAHTSLHVTVFTHQTKGTRFSSLLPQLKDWFSGELLTKLVLLACGYSVEEKEHSCLPKRVREMVTCVREEVQVEDRIKALEVLCWVASAAHSDVGR